MSGIGFAEDYGKSKVKFSVSRGSALAYTMLTASNYRMSFKDADGGISQSFNIQTSFKNETAANVDTDKLDVIVYVFDKSNKLIGGFDYRPSGVTTRIRPGNQYDMRIEGPLLSHELAAGIGSVQVFAGCACQQ
ncbi:hypothetical protein [Paenibacillus sp. MBLB4367]|uniref:hypothetical protein n=1 Tax=Paenibacillus sp. MBLB4367 TaxID=3384767 RepID=UPI0039081169